MEALRGSDVFHSAYQDDALVSSAAVPIMDHDSPNGCVYLMDYDAEQGNIIANLERTILQGSFVLLGAIILFSAFFATTSSRRMRKILTSMRMVREGEYSHKIQMRGSDEFATLATEFNKLTDRLQESEAQQRQFVSDASHELKTPLASIKLLSDSILQNEMDADTMREFVSDIGSEADRLTRMTQKLLTLNRAESAEVQHEIVDLSVTLSSVFRMLVPLADKAQIKLTAKVDRDCTILAFEDDAYQIMFNLVENGIKYNRPGGKVHVTVEHTAEDVVFSVQDTGVGIPDDAKEHIFERFYRVDKARSRQAGGSGLGLSIVHDLVARNFGAIDVKTVIGQGTCFTVTFPYFETEGLDDED
ncbi:MAG: HAMP domain-containing sensor histidine kinase [Oscillospiraceae bacterium]